MNKLFSIAKRISEISAEIIEAKKQRELSLKNCSGDEDYLSIDDGNCLTATYMHVMNERCDETGRLDDYFEILCEFGCKNCIDAYLMKRKIGLLKIERGRLVGNISKIGQSL